MLLVLQLENVIDEVLKTQDVHPLDSLLQKDPSEVTHVKCSQQFLTKLHKLIIRVKGFARCSQYTLICYRIFVNQCHFCRV